MLFEPVGVGAASARRHFEARVLLLTETLNRAGRFVASTTRFVRVGVGFFLGARAGFRRIPVFKLSQTKTCGGTRHPILAGTNDNRLYNVCAGCGHLSDDIACLLSSWLAGVGSTKA